MWLVGMMGSGKTTVGRKAATLLEVRFFDTDEMIEETAGMPITELWEVMGEEGFRELERLAVAKVPRAGCLAAAGGGAVMLAENRRHMSEGAPVIWLKSSPHHLVERLPDVASRPLLGDGSALLETLTRLLRDRAAWYSEVATTAVDTDEHDIDEVVEMVVGAWQD